MNEENHIIKFEYTSDLYKRLISSNDIPINGFKLSKKNLHFIHINIYYNNLNIYSSIPSNYYNYSFNLSNMLYKIHTPHYYSKIHQNKELI